MSHIFLIAHRSSNIHWGWSRKFQPLWTESFIKFMLFFQSFCKFSLGMDVFFRFHLTALIHTSMEYGSTLSMDCANQPLFEVAHIFFSLLSHMSNETDNTLEFLYFLFFPQHLYCQMLLITIMCNWIRIAFQSHSY